MGEVSSELSHGKVMLLKSASVVCMLVTIGCLSFAAGWLWIDTQYLQMGISPNVLLLLAVVGIGCSGLHGVFQAARNGEMTVAKVRKSKKTEGPAEDVQGADAQWADAQQAEGQE